MLISTLDGEVVLVVSVVKLRPICVCFVGSGGMAVASKATVGVERQKNGLCADEYCCLCRAERETAVRRIAKPNAAARFIEHVSEGLGAALFARTMKERVGNRAWMTSAAKMVGPSRYTALWVEVILIAPPLWGGWDGKA